MNLIKVNQELKGDIVQDADTLIYVSFSHLDTLGWQELWLKRRV